MAKYKKGRGSKKHKNSGKAKMKMISDIRDYKIGLNAVLNLDNHSDENKNQKRFSIDKDGSILLDNSKKTENTSRYITAPKVKVSLPRNSSQHKVNQALLSYQKNNIIERNKVIRPDTPSVLGDHSYAHISNPKAKLPPIDSNGVCYTFNEDLLNKCIKYDKQLCEELQSGKYFYYDDRIWLYHPDVISFENDDIQISETARENIKKYCLGISKERLKNILFPVVASGTVAVPAGFNMRYQRIRTRSKYGVKYKPPLRRKAIVSRGSVYSGESNDDFPDITGFDLGAGEASGASGRILTKKSEENPSLSKKLENEFDSIIRPKAFISQEEYEKILIDLAKEATDFLENGYGCYDFNSFFDKIMRDKDISSYKLSNLTDISVATIDRMRGKRESDGYAPELEYVVICCIVMRVFPSKSMRLIQLGGRTLRDKLKSNRYYTFFINFMYLTGSVKRCDKMLEEAKLPTLSSFVEKNKKNK